ncbi:peptide transporter family 1 isoform X2 [Condylostylus longicornis]|uniref:peptide transporter family 1 isoform X2 n=1 Tax=Condylostylus longicornis TaxID=2530218 RepID=UPI00244E05AC|nr:peptide transporter family 1 isoform X2 [Condylostylus longicornis]
MFKATNSLSEETLPGDDYFRNNKDTRLYDEQQANLIQNHNRKFNYPKAVIFVLLTKLFEAFAANGIRTILALYLRDDLKFTENFSTVMLHVFNFFGQFCPIFGAVIADSYLGNIKTVQYFSIVYLIGWIGLITTSLPISGIPVIFLISTALLFISIGNGSVRACITSLGAMQFKLPEQEVQLIHYFSHYYFVYYTGIFASKILPPLIRSDISCFEKNECYPAVFGVLGTSFFLSFDDNIVLEVLGCVKEAIVKKYNSSEEKHSKWLHYAIGKYSREFIDDVSQFFKVSTLFLPLPIYYALLAQQDSTWTFQATQMNTTILGIEIQPDQAKAMGPIFLFTMIPIWQYLFVPLLKKCNIQVHPLTSVAIGGLCSALAFCCAGLLQIQIDINTAKSISILWQIPQFILLMMGELYLSIPGLQFAFTQAPSNMKSVLTAAWFLNNAFGNLIVIFLTNFKIIDIQSSEYFIYAILMFLAIIIFTMMACNYLRDQQNLLFSNDEQNYNIRITTSSTTIINSSSSELANNNNELNGNAIKYENSNN